MPDDYKALVDGAVAALRAIMRVDADRIRDNVNHAHSVGAILDPTRYRAGMDSLDDQATIARAVRAAQREVLGSDRLTMLLTAADLRDGHEPWPRLQRDGGAR